jgi:hypothetical protein
MLMKQTFQSLQLPDVDAVPAQARMAVLLNPASYEAYYDLYGDAGISNLFVGIKDVHAREWANWFGETLTHKEERKEEALTALKETLDGLRDKHPTGPFSNIDLEHWYEDQLVPAAERKRKRWSNKAKRRGEVREIWGEGWEQVFDPGKTLPYSISHSLLTVLRLNNIGLTGVPCMGSSQETCRGDTAGF